MRRDEFRRQGLETLRYDELAFMRHIDAVSAERERDYLRSLENGFLDRSAHPSAPYVPRLLCNNADAAENVLVDPRSRFRP